VEQLGDALSQEKVSDVVPAKFFCPCKDGAVTLYSAL
jgi:hypothetical protein